MIYVQYALTVRCKVSYSTLAWGIWWLWVHMAIKRSMSRLDDYLTKSEKVRLQIELNQLKWSSNHLRSYLGFDKDQKRWNTIQLAALYKYFKSCTRGRVPTSICIGIRYPIALWYLHGGKLREDEGKAGGATSLGSPF